MLRFHTCVADDPKLNLQNKLDITGDDLASISLSMKQPITKQLQINGMDLRYYDWGDAGDPVLLFVHATGFHARIWDATVRSLTLPFNAICLDMRGHGQSDKVGPYDWFTLGNDVVAFIDELELQRIVAIGHSMGGYCIVQACAARPDRFSGLLLVDPVISGPQLDSMRTSRHTFNNVDDHPVARRRDSWASPNEMFDAFVTRRPFNLWRAEVLWDYCRWALQARNNEFALACPPRVEAEIYMNFHKRDTIYDAVKKVLQPVVVMRAVEPSAERTRSNAQLDFSMSPTWPRLAQEFENGRELYLPELTHFIPMQRPDMVADEIQELHGQL